MKNSIKKTTLLASIFLLQFIFAQEWESTITAQGVVLDEETGEYVETGTSDYIRIGSCDGCHDGFHFGEDEYDLPNGGDTYSDIQIFNYDWLGDQDANQNICNNLEFYVDKHALHGPEFLSEWLISGSTNPSSQITQVRLSWTIDNLINDIDIFLYIGDMSYDMKNQSSLIINSNELYTEIDFYTSTPTVNVKILSGGCANEGTTAYYIDEDGDGWGTGQSTAYCAGFESEGWVPNNSDLNDQLFCGSNEIDQCNVCNGENSDDLGCGWFEPSPSGCDSTCGSTLENDDCGVCDGGNNDLDDCGVCFGGNSDLDDCGVCFGGNSDLDDCGECNGFNQACTNEMFGDGPQNFSAFIDDGNIELEWDQPNYPSENGIVGFNIYIQNEQTEFIANTAEEFFSLSDYSEGTFCVSAYDQFNNESNYTCTEASAMITMDFELLNEANLISFRGIPEDGSVGSIFSSLGDNISGVIGEGVAANNLGNDFWVGALANIEPTSGYWIKLNNAPIQSFTIEAYPTDPNINYNLNVGHNLISYVGNDGMGISEAIPDEYENSFTGIIGQGVATIQLTAGWVGALVAFNHLKGYWVKVDEDMDFHWNITEDLVRESRPKIHIQKPIPAEFIYAQSMQQAFYFVENINIDDYDLLEDDWIIAYYDDTVIGARQWNGKYSDIPVMGIDGSDETFGYIEEGMIPEFKLFRESTGELLILEADGIAPWVNNGLTLIALYTQTQLINSDFPINTTIHGAYPNPFNPISTINFSLSENSQIELSIHNMNGEKIENLYNGYKNSGFHQIVWNAENMPSGMYFFTLNNPDGIHTQKLLLLK